MNISLKLDPMLPVIKNFAREADVCRNVRKAVSYFDSTAFNNLTLLSLRTLPYIGLGGSVVDGIAARARYLEGALMSTASFIHNAVFSGVFAALAILTLGQVASINENARRHLIHTALATAAVTTSLIGTVAPTAAAAANGVLWFGCIKAALMCAKSDQDVMERIKTAYNHQKQALKDATLEVVNKDQRVFDERVLPVFNGLDQAFTQPNVQFEDLCKAVINNLKIRRNVQVN